MPKQKHSKREPIAKDQDASIPTGLHGRPMEPAELSEFETTGSLYTTAALKAMSPARRHNAFITAMVEALREFTDALACAHLEEDPTPASANEAILNTEDSLMEGRWYLNDAERIFNFENAIAVEAEEV